MQIILDLKTRPLLASIFGWMFLALYYLLVGAFISLGASDNVTLLFASPAGILGMFFWAAAIIISVKRLVRGQNVFASIVGFIASVVPLGIASLLIILEVDRHM